MGRLTDCYDTLNLNKYEVRALKAFLDKYRDKRVYGDKPSPEEAWLAEIHRRATEFLEQE